MNESEERHRAATQQRTEMRQRDRVLTSPDRAPTEKPYTLWVHSLERERATQVADLLLSTAGGDDAAHDAYNGAKANHLDAAEREILRLRHRVAELEAHIRKADQP